AGLLPLCSIAWLAQRVHVIAFRLWLRLYPPASRRPILAPPFRRASSARLRCISRLSCPQRAPWTRTYRLARRRHAATAGQAICLDEQWRAGHRLAARLRDAEQNGGERP